MNRAAALADCLQLSIVESAVDPLVEEGEISIGGAQWILDVMREAAEQSGATLGDALDLALASLGNLSRRALALEQSLTLEGILVETNGE